MPFWKRTSPEEQERLLQSQQEAETSRRSLEAGRLPLQATRRLQEETEAGHSLFSSDLSTKEFLLTRAQGYQPLSQVMGSSIYHVGRQYAWTYSAYPHAEELTTLTQAHQDATRLAFSRLEQEALLLHAHGVIGVRFMTRDYEWGANLLEYTAIGTAIRLPDTPLPKRPFLSDLSGQEFWTLLQAGYIPVGVVTGFCSYLVSLGSIATNNLKYWNSWSNQEIAPFSQGIYDARHLAMNRVTSMARSFNAGGIVGMHINCKREVLDFEANEQSYQALWVQFAAIGTAIAATSSKHVIPSPKPTLSFSDLRPGRSRETQELTFKE